MMFPQYKKADQKEMIKREVTKAELDRNSHDKHDYATLL